MGKRIARERGVILAALGGAAFLVGDSLGWIESTLNREIPQVGVYLVVFISFAAFAVYRLVKLQTWIDESQERIHFTARLLSSTRNYPIPSRDEDDINIRIQLEIWTEIDVHTAELVLNVISIPHKRWWPPWKLFWKTKLRHGIAIEGQGDRSYRKQIKHTDVQPFKDYATFKWRVKREDAEWGVPFLLELALKTGIPRNVLRANIDMEPYRGRGVITPL